MSCGLALAASLALADLYGAGPAAAQVQVQATSPLAQEPLYAEIVGRAKDLKGRVEALRAAHPLKASATFVPLTGFDRFRTDLQALSALDMKGHLDLKARDADGDLKCILKGISEDLPRKLADVEAARTGAQEDAALDELAYLLDDNVGVITAPPKPPV
jgi:hypothetical protein